MAEEEDVSRRTEGIRSQQPTVEYQHEESMQISGNEDKEDEEYPDSSSRSCIPFLPGDDQLESEEETGEVDTERLTDVLEKVLQRDAAQNLNSVDISHSADVHVGNVTYIVGEVKVTQVIQETSLRQNVYLSTSAGDTFPADQLRIIRRLHWLAQPPVTICQPLRRPVNLVVICHTDTKDGSTMMTNMMLLRRLQITHVEGNNWEDIGYNFLIGMDGNVYEGRGWEMQGRHATGYNNNSLGIAFIGCFTCQLPNDRALVAFERLLDTAVSGGHLSHDYRLMAHCQLITTESPGREFYSLIKTWPRWTKQPPSSIEYPSDSIEAEKTFVGYEESKSPQINGMQVSEYRHRKSHSTIITFDSSGRQVAETTASCLDSIVTYRSEGSTKKTDHSISEPQALCDRMNDSDKECRTSTSCVILNDVDGTLPKGVKVPNDPQPLRDELSSSNSTTISLISTETGNVAATDCRGNLRVENSQNVHVGRTSYIIGDVNVSQIVASTSVDRRLFLETVQPGQSDFRLVRRVEWLALSAAEQIPLLRIPVATVVVCHTVTKRPDANREKQHVRSLQENHVHGRGFEDIAYNFLVAPSGSVYECRGWKTTCSLYSKFRNGCVTVGFIGDFSDQLPTERELAAFHWLLEQGVRERYLTDDFVVVGHCQMKETDCPGTALYEEIKTWQRWSSDPSLLRDDDGT